jgi:beta-phosphoglucomutase-like phosphatase (HAD superfamily)
MAKKKDTGAEPAKQTGPSRAVLFELEYVAVRGRPIVFSALKAALAERDIELTPTLFSQVCLDGCIKRCLSQLLEIVKKKRFSEEKLLEDIRGGVRKRLIEENPKNDPAFVLVLEGAAKRGARLGAMCGFDAETAKEMLAKTGLEAKGVALVSCTDESRAFPSADGWLRLAKDLSVYPSMCIALGTSGVACKSSLAAGMRCVALPDKFTEFQDFGGADFVIDDFTEAAAKDLLEILDS